MTDDEITALMRVKFEEYMGMRNGFHDHYCEKCGYGYVCPKVTHCNDPLNMLCLKHREADRKIKVERKVSLCSFAAILN